VQFNADIPTVWVRFGDWLAALAAAVALAALAVPGVRSSDSVEVHGRKK